MHTIDRHLFRLLTTNFLLGLGSMVVVVIALDAVINIGSLLQDLPGDHRHGPLLLQLYGNRLPQYLSVLLIPAFLVAIIASTAPMLRRGEFIALTSGGVSLQRATRAVIVFGLLCGILQVAITDQWAPPASARAEAAEDILHQQARGGRTWQVPQTGAHWFAQNADLLTEAAILEDVQIKTGTSYAWIESVRWNGESWRAAGRSYVADLEDDHGHRRVRHHAIELTGPMALPDSPDELFQRLLPDHTLPGHVLLLRGDRSGRTMVIGRWAWLPAPLLAGLLLLTVVIRFRNRDRIVIAVLNGLGVAAGGIAIIAVGNAVAASAPLPASVINGGAVALLAGVTWWVWQRWAL